MRVVFWARAQVALPMAASLRCGLLIGGMSQEDADAMIARFVVNPDGILVCTAAWQGKWKAGVEAMTVFTEDSFVGLRSLAAGCVLAPRYPPPTSEDFLEWYFGKDNDNADHDNTLRLHGPREPEGAAAHTDAVPRLAGPARVRAKKDHAGSR